MSFYVEEAIDPPEHPDSGNRTIRYKLHVVDAWDGKGTLLQFENGVLVNQRGPALGKQRYSWTGGGKPRPRRKR